MRYSAAEQLEIVRLVEQSPLPARRTLAQLGIPLVTFYRWYGRPRQARAGSLERSLAPAAPRLEPHSGWRA